MEVWAGSFLTGGRLINALTGGDPAVDRSTPRRKCARKTLQYVKKQRISKGGEKLLKRARVRMPAVAGEVNAESQRKGQGGGDRFRNSIWGA